MDIFRRRQKPPALPNDIINMMERFGRFGMNAQQGNIEGIGNI